jgi:PAS domain S-box-containing protein
VTDFSPRETLADDNAKRLSHEFALKDQLEDIWAVLPLELRRERGQTILLLQTPNGEPLDRLIGSPMELGRFLRLASSLAATVRCMHERGLVHKDIKPKNILVSANCEKTWITGFGIASRLLKEQASPGPPEFIAGTLPYIAPEQTGRMNRSVDSRSDLYSLGVTLYHALTGTLPFTAVDPTEWIHSHVAKRPAPPNERVKTIPSVVSAIVMKLLAKRPEERYQTAAGLEDDWRDCLAAWTTSGRIADFAIGARDVPDRILFPEKLYAREEERRLLLAAFARVAERGGAEFVLVAGYSGVGKSSIVNEVSRSIVAAGNLFASGKFDQYKHPIPYASVVQAFQSLVLQVLSKDDAELTCWREELQSALGQNGQLMVELIPELALVIGPQRPAPRIEPQDAQARFHHVFRSFLGVFARPEHPLTLFIDDLQWLDDATLDLLGHLITSPQVRYLLLIGAFRDNEVTPSHPLAQTLATIRRGQAAVSQIDLAPLSVESVSEFAADALHTGVDHVRPFAERLFAKTGGNPFFTNQLIGELAEEAALTFDAGERQWRWDLERVDARHISDNVADLVATKLNRLPVTARLVIGRLACLGATSNVHTLALACGLDEDDLVAPLRHAVDAGFIFRSNDSISFIHDRVQEAAYAIIPSHEKVLIHLRIGRLLLSATPPESIEEAAFAIVDQFARGRSEIRSREERVRVAELNLIAAKRATKASAYTSAMRFLVPAMELLGGGGWRENYRLTFDLERCRAECEFVTGKLAFAEERLTILLARAVGLPDQVEAVSLALLLRFTKGRPDLAIELGLEFLRGIGINWTSHPADGEVRSEYERMRANLARRPVETLLDAPAMIDPDCLATMNVLNELYPAAIVATGPNLGDLLVLRMVNLGLEHGLCDAGTVAFAALGLFLGPRFADYQTAYRFGKVACTVEERRGTERTKSRIYSIFAGTALPWVKHISQALPLQRLSVDLGRSSGDTAFAAYTWRHIVTTMLVSGAPLVDVQQEAERAIAFARSTQLNIVPERLVEQLPLILFLRGLPSDDAHNDDQWAREDARDNRGLAQIVGFHWVLKLQERFFAGEYVAAIEAATYVEPIRWGMLAELEEADYDFYAALAYAALCVGERESLRAQHLSSLCAHACRIRTAAEHCPENFSNRDALVSAELARLEGRLLDAEVFYEEAIRSARQHGFIQNEALAHELASSFYSERKLETSARAHIQAARSCYLRWGADGKVRQLDNLHPKLEEYSQADSGDTISAHVEKLDLATIMKVSHAVSGEMVLERLIATVMRTAIEHAGAERGLLVLLRGSELRTEAEATTGEDAVSVQLVGRRVASAEMPEAILNYILRTQDIVILDDAANRSPFADDPYIKRRQSRSILCVPLMHQAKLTGALYLENNLTTHAFTPARITVLKLLASQAAISLENTQLYRDVRQRETKIRRLVDADIIGICFWDYDGRILEANDCFLQMLGYDRADFAAGKLLWTDLTPPEWLESDLNQRVPKIEHSLRLDPFEKEFFRKDGGRVPVLMGAAAFEEGGSEGVAYVIDLTERKRAEANVRESEQRYREVQNALAHANRVATMGQLTASIAHEASQPITTAITNAEAALRWLTAKPPNLAEVREALSQIVASGNRTGDVIGGIRALVKKAPTRKDLLDINGAIREVIELTDREAKGSGVSLRAQLADGLPHVRGDRVQLQQVMLNLIVNALQAMADVPAATRELAICTDLSGPDEVLVTVRDTGPGLAPSIAEHLFAAFYTTKPDGMGMGLSICRSIVEAHGGRMWVSVNVPRGAIFHFTAPAAYAEA